MSSYETSEPCRRGLFVGRRFVRSSPARFDHHHSAWYRIRMSIRRITLILLLATATGACGFLQSQTRISVAAQCQESCANVPANTQGQCIARCQ